MGFLAPVFTLIGGVLGTAIGKMVVGIGLNLIVSKMQARRAKKAQQQAGGTQFERDYGEDISRKAACGPVGIAGMIAMSTPIAVPTRTSSKPTCFRIIRATVWQRFMRVARHLPSYLVLMAVLP